MWIIACIHIHAFAMRHEEIGNISRDSSYKEGRMYQQKAARVEQKWKREQRQRMVCEEEELEAIDDIELLEGKIKREKLKEKLFTFLGEDN
jgi:hypothetical protein